MSRIVFTTREEELMNFLWDYGEALTANDMICKCKDHSWSDNYIRVMLRALEKKGAIELCGLEATRTQYARKFKPAISKEDFYLQYVAGAGIDINAFAKSAVSLAAKSKEGRKDELIQKLEQVIKEYRAEEEKNSSLE